MRKTIITITEDCISFATISSAYTLSVFQSILKTMINIDFRDLIYFNYRKMGYIRRDYLVQRQTNINKKVLQKIRIYEFTIDNEYEINLLADAYEASKDLGNK